MKLLVYGTDGSAPIQFNDVAKIERVFPDGSTKTMKVVPAPLQFTHEPANDWTHIMHYGEGRPVEETLPPENELAIFCTNTGYVFSGYFEDNRLVYDTGGGSLSIDKMIAWKPWPDPAPNPEANR